MANYLTPIFANDFERKGSTICAKNKIIMLKVIIFSIIIIGVAVLLLCIRILLKKNGHFVKTHVSQSKAMRERGVTCIQSQDFAMRHKSPYAVQEN